MTEPIYQFFNDIITTFPEYCSCPEYCSEESINNTNIYEHVYTSTNILK